MLGGIYTDQKCEICGEVMQDDGRSAVRCPQHKRQVATRFIVRFGREVFKRFTSYDDASRFLTGVRFKTDEGTYDVRDYQNGNPLGFSNLVEKYLNIKQEMVKASSFAKIRADMERAKRWFGNISVKDVQYGQLEDFLLGQKEISSKTRHNIKANLHAFFVWLLKRREIRKDQMPEFPEIAYELGYRKTIEKSVQDSILEEVKALTMDNPRIYLGVRMLATYVSIRPGELRGVLEEDVDTDKGLILIRDHKTVRHTKMPKIVPLLPEDVEFIKALPRGFPKMHFFRRDKGGGGRASGHPFGRHLLYDYWKLACDNLGIEGVDLYGGTRHSSMQDLRKSLSPEGVKRLSMHSTNKALDRYLKIDVEELREGYALTRVQRDSKIIPIKGVNTGDTPKTKSRPL